jgi:hypothetical protein
MSSICSAKATNVRWAKEFNCPVYIADEDKQWLMRKDTSQNCWIGSEISILPEVTIVKVGGHFPGSNMRQFMADLRLVNLALESFP